MAKKAWYSKMEREIFEEFKETDIARKIGVILKNYNDIGHNSNADKLIMSGILNRIFSSMEKDLHLIGIGTQIHPIEVRAGVWGDFN